MRSGEDEDSLEGAPRPATSQPGHRQSLGDASSCGQVQCSSFWFFVSVFGFRFGFGI